MVTDGRPLNGWDKARLTRFIAEVTAPFPTLDTDLYLEKNLRTLLTQEPISEDELMHHLILTALENVDEAGRDWTYVASRIELHRLYTEASKNRGYHKDQKYGDYYELQKMLVAKGIYSPNILEKYSREEIEKLSQLIKPERDDLFDYIGLHTLKNRYLATDYDKKVYELPQERWLTIALF